MKKSIFALLLAAMVVSLGAISCDKEKSDYDKGFADGKAACDCMINLPQEPTKEQWEACNAKIDESKMVDTEDESKWTDYQKGVMEGAKDCIE